MARATVTSKRQITIPLVIRQRLALEPGSVLEFDESAENLEATKAIDRKRMHAVVGIAADVLDARTTNEWPDDDAAPVQGGATAAAWLSSMTCAAKTAPSLQAGSLQYRRR